LSDIKLPIYLDYSATTPIDQRVASKMAEYLTIEGNFGNPASRSHEFGWTAEKAVDLARQQVADLINADPREIVWTSGATESDNLAIKGAAHFYRKKGNHIITLKTEHKAVLDTCRQLEREGFEVTYLDPQENGLLDMEDLKAAVTEQTILISIMHVNNEIGVIQDIAAIGEFARENKIIFHVDAAQSTGKVDIDLEQLKVDLSASHAYVSRRKCTVAATSAVCVPAPWRRTRSWVWVKLSASRRKRWRPRTSASVCYATDSTTA
jgi:cysteine desulfurase